MTANSRSNMDMLKAQEVLVALKDFECIGVSLSFRVFIRFQHHGHRQLLGDPKPDTWRTIQCSSPNIDRPADMTTDQGPRYCLCNATGTSVDHPGDVEFQGGSCSYITRLRMMNPGTRQKERSDYISNKGLVRRAGTFHPQCSSSCSLGIHEHSVKTHPQPG
jgi:hypothetical protein